MPSCVRTLGSDVAIVRSLGRILPLHTDLTKHLIGIVYLVLTSVQLLEKLDVILRL